MEPYLWAVLLVAGLHALARLGAIVRSLQGIEAMMRRLLAEQGVEWQVPVEPSEKVRDLAARPGMQIAAIRAYREQTGLDLREAKAVVDGLARHGRGAA